MDDALDTLERSPEIVFLLDGQTAVVDDYLAVRPEARDRVAALVEAGRLVIGPWHVLADELLAGDEILVRNLLLGRRIAADLGGWLGVGYSPDAFGHPAAMPTILAGFGIGSAIVWRGRGGGGDEKGEEGEEILQYGDLFWWEGPEGSRVLTHHLPPQGYELGAELPADAAALRERWERIRATLAPRAAVPVLYVPNGADHHALQPDLPAVVARLAALYPDVRFEVGSPARYFDLVRPDAETAGLPAVHGELRDSHGYTWTLQGVHATRAGLKRAVAEAGLLLQRFAEPFAALAPTDRRPLLRAAWREHLLNYSHDVIGGCCSDAVAADARQRARHVAEQANGIIEDALHERLGQDRTRARRQPDAWEPHLVLANPVPYRRAGVVEATVTVKLADVVVGRPGGREPPPADAPPPEVLDAEGRPLPMQVLYTYDAHERLDSPRDYPDQDLVRAWRVALHVPEIPPLGIRAFRVRPGGFVTAPQSAFRARRSALTLPELISERDFGDTYTFEPAAGDAPLVAEWSGARDVWDGPLVTVVARDFTVADRAMGTLFVRHDAGSALTRYTVEGVNLSGAHRLRIVFPLPVPTREAMADMHFGPTCRPLTHPTVPPRPQEWPVTTAPMHRYVSAGPRTIFGRGCFEYELLDGQAIAITLLRAVDQLSRGDLGARPGHAGWPVPTPDAQELGPFRVELAVAPAAPAPDGPPADWSAVERLADEFHAPLAATMLRWGVAVPGRVGGPRLDGEGLAFRACKPREEGEGVVLRCVNLTNESRTGTWTWPDPVRRACRARLDETEAEVLSLSEGGRQIRFGAGPREVVTIVVETSKRHH